MSDAEETAPAVSIGSPVIDMSHANGELLAAWAEAQGKAMEVTKGGRNTSTGDGYKYATADSMIAEARGCREGTGLCLFSTWSSVDFDDGSEGKQWVCAIVTVHWVMGHGSGGYVRGTITGHAIGSKGRPPDKAVAAAATYIEGFLDRGLMRLSRGGESADDVDRRSEGSYERPKHQPRHTTEHAKPSAKPPSEWSAAEFRAFGKNSGRVADVKAKGQADQCIALAAEAGIPRDEARGWFTPPRASDDDDGGPGVFPLRDGTLSADEEERVFADLGDAHAPGDEK